ncbi:MAG: HEAT repeat domain-containing protein, partial [Proteobacteria bacterium]|nr:HEAT repeat domain-containing protein [Pseudomonadota bacterium]
KLIEALEAAQDPATFVEAIAHMGGTAYDKWLLPLLRHPDAMVRMQAVSGLGQSTEGAVFVSLLAILRLDEDSWVRRAAAISLGELGSEVAFDALMAAADDTDLFGRSGAELGLGLLGDCRAAPLLLSRLQDNRSRITSAAHTALIDLSGVWHWEHPDEWAQWWEDHQAECSRHGDSVGRPPTAD